MTPDPSTIRAEELIRLLLRDQSSEADLMLSVVPRSELRPLAAALLTHAAHAYREGFGTVPALLLLSQFKKEA